MGRSAASLVAAALLLGACSDGGEEAGPSATVGTATRETTTTTAPDPYAIPDDPAGIDVAYVQRVVDALFEVDARATRVFVETGTLAPEGVAYLEAIYEGEELEEQVGNWEQILAEGRTTNFVERPGAVIHEIVGLMDARPTCVFLEAQRDRKLSVIEAPPPRRAFLGLAPATTGATNPTPWRIFSDGVSLDDREVESPCVGF